MRGQYPAPTLHEDRGEGSKKVGPVVVGRPDPLVLGSEDQDLPAILDPGGPPR